MLRAQVAESRRIAAQNRELRDRAVDASARATAQAERSLRRVGADLHDGPAQYVALAAMRLDSIAARDRGRPRRSRDDPRRAADRARRDPRDLARAVAARPRAARRSPRSSSARSTATARHADAEVDARLRRAPPSRRSTSRRASASTASCRRRCRTPRATPRARRSRSRSSAGADAVIATVRDDGPGFDPRRARGIRPDGGEGLAGLRDRAESIGGELDIDHRARARARRSCLTLPLGKGDPP